MKRKTLIVATLILLGSMARAQDEGSVLKLDLQGAIDYAMQHNKNLENARQELIKSDKSVWEAISQGLPQVDASLDYMTNFGFEMEFPSFIPGGEPTKFELGDQMTAKMQLSQLVFSGQYIVGIQTAKLAKIISEQALDNSEISTKESVINAYYLVLISESSLKMVKENMENLDKILNQTEKMYEAGMAEHIDVDQFQVNVNQLSNTIRSMNRNLEITYNMLRFTLGIPAGSEIILTDDLESLFNDKEASDLLANEFNKESNIGYQILSSQAAINKKLWDMQKWNYGPTLAGFASATYKIKTSSFDMNPPFMAGFSFSLPIFSSGMRDAKVGQARIDYEIAERNVEILGDQLELQENQLKYDLQNSLENYYTQKENVDVARRVLDNYEQKYKHGMASSMEVTQANSSFLDAQSSFLSAMFEVMNAQIQLEKLMNNLSTL